VASPQLSVPLIADPSPVVDRDKVLRPRPTMMMSLRIRVPTGVPGSHDHGS
jgi:hypothetical protein